MEGLPISSKTEKTTCDDFSDSDSDDLSDPYSTDASDPYSSDLYDSCYTPDISDPDSEDDRFSDSDSDDDNDDQDFPTSNDVANPKAGVQPLPAKDTHGKASVKHVINGAADQGADETKVAELKDTGEF